MKACKNVSFGFQKTWKNLAVLSSNNINYKLIKRFMAKIKLVYFETFLNSQKINSKKYQLISWWAQINSTHIT